MIYWIRFHIFTILHRLNKKLYYKLAHILYPGRRGKDRWAEWYIQDYNAWIGTNTPYSYCIDCGAEYSQVEEPYTPVQPYIPLDGSAPVKYQYSSTGEGAVRIVPCGCLNVTPVDSSK